MNELFKLKLLRKKKIKQVQLRVVGDARRAEVPKKRGRVKLSD